MVNLITARRISKSFQDGKSLIKALHGANVSIKQGEFVMIIGPSGSGKTTLLQILGMLLTPDKGSIRFLGQDVSEMSAFHKSKVRLQAVGFIFQDHNLIGNLTAVQNVCVPLDLLGYSDKVQLQVAQEKLADLHLGSRADTLVSKLSGGEKQRVAIARAFSHEPKILLADEPTAWLDQESTIFPMIDELMLTTPPRGSILPEATAATSSSFTEACSLWAVNSIKK